MRMRTSAWCFALLWALALAQVPAPFNLQTSYLTGPIAIDSPTPRLSWNLMHPSKAQKQTAFRVVVSKIGSGIVWDSQLVKSSKNHVNYGSVGSATELVSDASYSWQVTWWDANATQSAMSEVAYFGTGYLHQSDWTASWIGGSGNLLRKTFTLSSYNSSTTSRVYVSGLGYYELYINGQRVGDAHLDVGWTDYSKRCLYNAYDVSSLLVQGDNAIGVMQGHGWYSSTESREPNGPRSVILQLSVGGKVVVQTDDSWTNSQGPIIYDGIYNGETYDARLEQDGWATAAFTPGSASWTSASVETAPGGVLSFQAMPPVRRIQEITAKAITNPQPNVYVVDFEQNFSGWCKITMQAAAGKNITLQHAEVLLKDNSGLVYTANLRGAKATDTYIFKGSSTPEVYEPRFTYHGFRYVQIYTYGNVVPTLSNIVGIQAHSDVMPTGDIDFVASSNILNMIQHNILWGQASNLMSVPTDCDQRDERKGWMGDAQLSAEEAIHNFYMPAFYTNFLRNIQDEQDSAGTLTDTVPWTFGSRPADPAWGSAYPSILYWVFKYYDDIALVGEHYDNIKLYLGFLAQQHDKTGLSKFYYNYGDWVPPPPFDMCSSHLTSSFSYLANIQQFIEMATALGNTSDVQTYTNLLNSLSSEFNSAFYNNSGNCYDTGLQSAQALALFLGLVPTAKLESVVIHLLNDIVSAQHTHLTTGIIGTKYLMLALHNLGRDDLALQLAENFDYPSWGYMAVHPSEPATTLWELWDSPNGDPGMDSRNHIMFGSVGDWFYKALAGIDHQDSDQGFEQFTIAPSVVGDLQAVNAYFLAGTGNISVTWQKTGGEILCGSAPAGHMIELDCSSIGSEGVIEEIMFASYGLPRGTCGAYGEHEYCNTPTAHKAVESMCLGQKYCKFEAHEDYLGTASCDELVFKRMHVQAKCGAAAATSFALQASIPVGSTANVVLPALDLTQVQVSVNGATVWSNDKYIGGAAGVFSGVLDGTNLAFVVGSGSYAFKLNGNPGTVVCADTTENFNLTVACPSSDLVITQVQFASFGTPYGQCGNYQLGSCNAGSSKYLVEKYCLLQSKCTFPVDDKFFGEPCYNTPKNFATQVVCASI